MLVFVVGVALGLAGLLRPGPVDATNHSASRQFSQPWVLPGGELTVTITATGYGALGQVVETLPTGFGYVSSGLQVVPVVEGQIVTFTLLGDKSVTYTVTAPTEEGVYTFAGVLKDSEKVERPVGGHSQITVSATPAAYAHTNPRTHGTHGHPVFLRALGATGWRVDDNHHRREVWRTGAGCGDATRRVQLCLLQPAGRRRARGSDDYFHPDGGGDLHLHRYRTCHIHR